MNQKRRLFQKKKSKSDPSMTLQITSMADVFTILLVFLLKGIANDVLQITPANATQLPTATSTRTLTERALQVEITPTEVLVEKESIGNLESFQNPFMKKLQAERLKNDLISKANPSVKSDQRAIILADQKTPYLIIKSVLGGLSKHGYSEIHFAVMER